MEDRAEDFDVVIVGGGAAGLSAAVTLARARRRIAVIDEGTPRNARADGVHGFLTRDGVSPFELLRLGREEARRYGGTVLEGSVVAVSATPENASTPSEPRFAVELSDGRVLSCRRVLVTSGLHDALPDIPGVAERFGRDVVHCPYCHGWEVRERPIGILGAGPFAAHQALLFRQWSDEVTLFVHAPEAEPTDDEWEKLRARRIQVVTGPVARLRIEADALTGVELASGTVVPVSAVAVATLTRSRADFVRELGVELSPHPMSGALRVEADTAGRTSVAGVWAAGNVADPMQQVIAAAANGVAVAAQLNFDLIEADTAVAVAAQG